MHRTLNILACARKDCQYDPKGWCALRSQREDTSLSAVEHAEPVESGIPSTRRVGSPEMELPTLSLPKSEATGLDNSADWGTSGDGWCVEGGEDWGTAQSAPSGHDSHDTQSLITMEGLEALLARRDAVSSSETVETTRSPKIAPKTAGPEDALGTSQQGHTGTMDVMPCSYGPPLTALYLNVINVWSCRIVSQRHQPADTPCGE